MENKMETDPTYPNDLITRYLAGEAEEDDLIFLEEWLKADLSHRTYFDSCRKTWEALEQERVGKRLDENRAWERFEQLRMETAEDHLQDFDLKMGGWRFRLTPSVVLRYAAIFFILCIPAVLLYHHYTKPELKELTASQSVMEGTLPDGSLVTLNTGSRIEYPAAFDRFKRGVTLEGEAFFEVQHNSGTPFVIYYKNARVEVLGTKFYVNTRKDNGQMEVILQEGSVSVYFKSKPDIGVTLTPGEKAEVTEDQTNIYKRENDDENYLAWKTQRFVFTDTDLAGILRTLNKVYRSDIRLGDPRLGKCRMTATFENQSLESVLSVIKATLGLEVVTTGNTITISGKPCE